MGGPPHPRFAARVASTVSLVFLSACAHDPNHRLAPPGSVIDTGAFQHEAHLRLEGLRCQSCHAVRPEAGFATIRPGSSQHGPCDDSGCHARQFYQAPGPLCAVCHASVEPTTKGASPLAPYPRRIHAAQLISSFDHQLHLSGEQVRTSSGALACGSCHAAGGPDSAYVSFPAHAQCVACHEKDAGPRMPDCAGCHAQDGPGRERHFIRNDLRFTHGKHQATPDGAPIPCQRCHYSVAESRTASELHLPLMSDCAKCHGDPSKTPDPVRITNCGVCHTSDVRSRPLPGDHTAALERPADGAALASRMGGTADRGGVTALLDLSKLLPSFGTVLALRGLEAPTGAGPSAPEPGAMGARARPRSSRAPEDGLEERRPEDHTVGFRLRHERAARSKDAKCGYCHEGLSGSPRDSCQDCHAVSRPRSHTARFVGPLHGRLAAKDASRCATCHEVDFCSACHQIAPDTHFPRSGFLLKHARLGRSNPRSCLTCHTFEATCSECHDSANLGPGTPQGAALRRALRGGR